MRRDSSPFRGAEGWVEAVSVCTSVSHGADTYVSLTPVGGGVLDAPRSWECRGGVGADSRRGRLRRRLMRRVRLCLLPNVCDFAGTARAPFLAGEPTSSVIPGREGVEALPYGVLGRFWRVTGAFRRPKAGRRGRRPLRAVCLLQVAAFDVRAQPAHHFVRASEAVLHPRPGGRGSPPLRCEWECFGAEPALSAAPRITCRTAFAPGVFYRQV